MEEEEDKDDKKDKMERQCQAAEASQQEEISTPRVQSETSKDTDNKGAQVTGSEVFQKTSEVILQAQNENGINANEGSITQMSDTVENSDEPSLNTGADNEDSLSHSDGAAEKENTEGAVLKDKHRYENADIVETLEKDRSGESSQISKESSNENVAVQLQQAEASEENELITENLESQIQESSARETTNDKVQLEEKDTINVAKDELKQSSSPKQQGKRAVLGDIRESQNTVHESKQGSSEPLSRKQNQVNKGQKPVEAVRQTGREIVQKEVKEKIHNKLQTKKQDLQSTTEVNKMQQRKGESEQPKTQSDQKLKTEEKQMVQAKEGKKQPLSQKEPRIMSKQAEARKIDKREQKFPAVHKQSLPSKKSPVHRKEPTQSSPKRNAPSQPFSKEKQNNLQKKVKQKGSNANVIQNKEIKETGQLQHTEDSLLDANDQQNPTPSHSPTPRASVETSAKSMSQESIASLCKSEKESGKELLKGHKKQEAQAQGTNKLSEKKSQQEKQNEIQKQRKQNEVNQQLKQLKKESLQSTEQGNKISQKFGKSTKVSVPQKKEESSVPLVTKKQASKANKELREVQKSTQLNQRTKVTQQQVKVMDKNSAKEQQLQIPACLKEEEEGEKASKNSVKQRSSGNVIHSIRRQYQQLCKEESLQQRLLDESPHSHQPAQKEEKVQKHHKPEAKGEDNKVGTKENVSQLAQKKSEDSEDDKGLGCGGMQGSSCPIYFGVKSYLHHFYDTTPVKDPHLFEEYTEEDDFEYAVDPVKSRGCRKCCQGFWFRAGLWGGINLILVGVITFLVGYLTPQREVVVGQQGDLEILDRSAIIFNHRLELCRLAGLAVFCCGGMVLFFVLFISTLLHVRGRYNNENMCCTENVYYGYATAPLVEPFIVTQAPDLTIPSTGIKIPIIEEIKSVQPTIWPEMGTVKEGSRVGQMP